MSIDPDAFGPTLGRQVAHTYELMRKEAGEDENVIARCQLASGQVIDIYLLVSFAADIIGLEGVDAKQRPCAIYCAPGEIRTVTVFKEPGKKSPMGFRTEICEKVVSPEPRSQEENQ